MKYIKYLTLILSLLFISCTKISTDSLETVKISESSFQSTNNFVDQRMYLDLYRSIDSGKNFYLVSSVLLRYQNGWCACVIPNTEDILAISSGINSYREGYHIISERRPVIGSTDTTFLWIDGLGNWGTYPTVQFKLVSTTYNWEYPQVSAMLWDSYTNTANTNFGLPGGAIATIYVTSDPRTFNQQRFQIRFYRIGIGSGTF